MSAPQKGEATEHKDQRKHLILPVQVLPLLAFNDGQLIRPFQIETPNALFSRRLHFQLRIQEEAKIDLQTLPQL